MSRVIVTGGTRDDVAPIAVFAMNIKQTNADLFDKLIVFHDGIKPKDQQKINEIMETEFIEYHFPYETRNDVIVNYFTPMLFCKYECFKLLERFDEVVWSDYDVVIRQSLDSICQFTENCQFQIVADDSITIRHMFYKHVENQEIFQYDLTKEGICTPLFSMTRRIGDYQKMYDWCYEKTVAYEKDIQLAEQCIISLLVQAFQLQYQKLEPAVWACHPRDAKGNEMILHAYGQPKFWNGCENADWNQNYQEWLRMGGTPYHDFRKKMMGKWRLLCSRIKGIRAKEFDENN